MAARARSVAVLVLVAGTAAAGPGVVATPPVTFVVTGSGTGTATAALQNTSTGAFQVALVRDPSCDPDIDFSIAGGNPFTLPGSSSKQITFACSNAKLGLERCTVHAIDASSREPLADLAGACEHVSSAALAETPSTLAFGSVDVGDTVALPLVLTNNGTSPIKRLDFETDELDDNFEVALPCNPDSPACDGTVVPVPAGGSTNVVVHCSPRTSGVHTAHLEIATDGGLHLAAPIALTCTGVDATAPVLGVLPPAVSIAAPVDVVSSTVHTTVYLQNLGTGAIKITDIRPVDIDQGAAFDWTFTLSGTCTSVSCMLGPGQQVAVDLAFDPSQPALRRALLLVLFRDTIDRTRTIPLTGTGLGATLQLVGTPSTLDLGSVPLGRSTSTTLHFGNTGNRDTTAMLGLAPIGPFSLAPPATLTVPPTAIADLLATCTPSTAGAAGTTISATSTDTIAMTTLQVAATCTGTSTPLYAMPTSVDLGEVRLGGGGVYTFDVLSNGAPLTISGNPHLDTADPNLTVGVPTSTTTPASFDLTVTPQAEGDLRSHITIDDTAGDRIEIPITGRIVTASYAKPQTVDLGTFCVNQPTTPSNATLTSNGTATLGLTAPELSPGAPFALDFVSPTVYPALLPAGKTATVSVTPLRQTGKAMLTGTLTWSTDVAAMPTATTTLTANFIDSGGAIAPTTLPFGRVPVHLYLANGQIVTIQNCSNSLLELEPPTVPVPFSIDSPNFPTELAPSETATFTVGFHPTKVADDVQADLVIRSPQLPGSPLVVHLSGSAITDPPPAADGGSGNGPVPSESFYACSCGSSSPGGGVPIVLALAIIFRRRGGSS